MRSRNETAVVETGTILDRIAAHKRQEVDARKCARSLKVLCRAAAQASPPRDFACALGAPGISLITEVKRASPSQGILCSNLDPSSLARAYVGGGAAALSVLTDLRFFGGTLQDLQDVHDTVPVPVLRKDFILDPYQVYEARAGEADAVLLIMAILTNASYMELLALTRDLGMAALVEVHDRIELDRALAAGPRVVGINNRNLHTFEVTLDTTRTLARRVPEDRLIVSESGLYTPADLADMARYGARCFLIGESLMRQDDVEAATRTILANPRVAQGGL